jgi:hypothetical protein
MEVLNRAGAYGDTDLFDHLVARGAKPSHSIALHHTASSERAISMIAHLIDKYHFNINGRCMSLFLKLNRRWGTERDPRDGKWRNGKGRGQYRCTGVKTWKRRLRDIKLLLQCLAWDNNKQRYGKFFISFFLLLSSFHY